MQPIDQQVNHNIEYIFKAFKKELIQCHATQLIIHRANLNSLRLFQFNMELTLTDSTTPKVSPFFTSAPTSGSSTYTTSPSSLCIHDEGDIYACPNHKIPNTFLTFDAIEPKKRHYHRTTVTCSSRKKLSPPQQQSSIKGWALPPKKHFDDIPPK